MNFAPVIVFNYNRPEHSMRTWEALSRNQFASETELYLYCDGPKDGASEEMKCAIASLHEQAEKYSAEAKKEGKFKDIHVVCAERNKGLANSIIGGVTEVVNRHGKVIVLEDDLVSSPYLLKYMNEALDYYQNYGGVMSISANRPPMSKMQIPEDYQYDVFACLRSYSTGWATWRDRWSKVDWTMDDFERCKSNPDMLRALNRLGEDFAPMMQMQVDGKIDSWAVRFGFSHFKNHSVAILPCKSYVTNIGFDGTGTHSGTIAKTYENDLSQSVENPRFLDVVYEDDRIINAFYSSFYPKRRPLWKKAVNFIARKLGKKPPFVIKKKVYE